MYNKTPIRTPFDLKFNENPSIHVTTCDSQNTKFVYFQVLNPQHVPITFLLSRSASSTVSTCIYMYIFTVHSHTPLSLLSDFANPLAPLCPLSLLTFTLPLSVSPYSLLHLLPPPPHFPHHPLHTRHNSRSITRHTCTSNLERGGRREEWIEGQREGRRERRTEGEGEKDGGREREGGREGGRNGGRNGGTKTERGR